MTEKEIDEFLEFDNTVDGVVDSEHERSVSETTSQKPIRDCGVKRGLPVVLTSDRLTRFYGRYIIEEDGCVQLTKENAATYLNREIWIRSLAFCSVKNGYCEICAGANNPYLTKEVVEVAREELRRVSNRSYLQALWNGQEMTEISELPDESNVVHAEKYVSKEVPDMYEDAEIFNFVPEVSERTDTKKLFSRYFQRDMKNFYEEFKYLTDAYSIVLEFEVMHWNEYIRLIVLGDKCKNDADVKDTHDHWVKSCLYRAERLRLKEALVNVLDKLHSGDK